MKPWPGEALAASVAYLLQHDASQYGASTQQQRQQAHHGHGDIERHPGVVLRWRFKRSERQVSEQLSAPTGGVKAPPASGGRRKKQIVNLTRKIKTYGKIWKI